MYRLASQVLARLSCVAVKERCSSLNTGMVTDDGSFCSTRQSSQTLFRLAEGSSYVTTLSFSGPLMPD